MVKKNVVWFLVLAFVNLVITPGFAFAQQGFGPIDIDTGPSHSAVLIGGLIVVAVCVGIYLLTKRSPTPNEQPQGQKQEAPQSLHFQQPDEQLTTPPGQIALLRW
jgi:hypothetical protein